MAKMKAEGSEGTTTQAGATIHVSEVVLETTVRGRPVKMVRDERRQLWLLGLVNVPTAVSSVELGREVLSRAQR